MVCDVRYGTGKVDALLDGGLSVVFDNDAYCSYCKDGREIDGELHASLYHGTWEQVFGKLPDLKPKRKVKRWANLYGSGEWKIFNDKDIAKDFAETTPFKVIAVAVEIEVDE